jgi:hypothetical protein
MYKGGCLYPFSLSKLKLSNLQLNFYLTALNLLNAFLSTKDESLKAQGPLYNTSALLYEQLHKGLAQQLPKHFKICARRYPAVFSAPRAGSLDE